MFSKVNGVKQSPIEGKLLKDGKALGVKEMETIVTEEKVTFKLKKTLRAMSGTYQIKLSNAQGDSIKDVFVNIQGETHLLQLLNHLVNNTFFVVDVPTAPEDIQVEQIFQDSCVLKWKKPKDDGGVTLTNYIIERQDLSVKGEQ